MSKHSNANRTGRAVWYWAALVAFALLLTLLLYSSTFKSFLAEAIAWTKEIMGSDPVLGAVAFFLFSAFSAMFAFASSVVLVPAANEVFGKPVTFLLLWGGWITGATAAYGIGRLARPFFERLGYRKKLEEYHRFVSRRMKFWVVVLFCMAVPSEIPGYLFGGLHYPFVKFLAAIGIAEAVYALGLVIAGERLVSAEPLPFLITVGILIAIAAGAGLLLRKIKQEE